MSPGLTLLGDDSDTESEQEDEKSVVGVTIATPPPRRTPPSSSTRQTPRVLTSATKRIFSNKRRTSPRKKVATATTRNNEAFHKDIDMLEYNDGAKFKTLGEKEAAIRSLEQRESGCDPDGVNECTFIRKGWRRNGTHNMREILYCAFHNECSCNWRCEVIRVHDKTDHAIIDYYYIRVGTVTHAKHSVFSNKMAGVPRLYKKYLCSNKDMPAEVLGRILSDGHLLDEQTQAKIIRWVTYAKRKHRNRNAPKGMDTNSWEILQEKVEQHSRANVEKGANFDEHTPYVVGEWTIKPNQKRKDSRVIIVISTRNLLLNAVRQQQCGMDLAFHVDASYSYTVERNFGLLPIIAASPTQEGRLIATAIINKEDGGAHEVVFQTFKSEVEQIMGEIIERGIDYI
jgi:hypothetical protein